MDAASSAINNLFSKAPTPGTRGENDTTTASSNTTDTSSSVDTSSVDKDTNVTQEVAPAVEHAKITKQHETREQEVVEKERHQDHFHTTIQPLKDSEVLPEKHDETTAETQYRNVNNDSEQAKAQADADRSGFQNTTEESKTLEAATQEPTQTTEHVHHHLHETIQPVIEKEIIDPSVTHKTIPIKERIQEESQNHGVTTNKPMSVDDFKNKAGGDSTAATSLKGDVVTE